MHIKKLFLLGCLTYLSVGFSISSKNLEEELLISEAYVFLEKKELVAAGKTVKKLQSDWGLNADGFFIFGEIHFHSGLYKSALNYYEKANQNLSTFVDLEDRYALWWKMVLSYQKLGQFSESIPVLKRIVTEITKEDFSTSSEPLLGRAYFELGLTFRVLQKWSSMNEFFLKAIAQDHMKFSAYLFLLYYLAGHSQEEINSHFTSGQTPPTREEFFTRYYGIWNSLKMDAAEQIRFESLGLIYRYPDLSIIINEVAAFQKSLTILLPISSSNPQTNQ